MIPARENRSQQCYHVYKVILKYVIPLRRYDPHKPILDARPGALTSNQTQDGYIELTASGFNKNSMCKQIHLYKEYILSTYCYLYFLVHVHQ